LPGKWWPCFADGALSCLWVNLPHLTYFHILFSETTDPPLLSEKTRENRKQFYKRRGLECSEKLIGMAQNFFDVHGLRRNPPARGSVRRDRDATGEVEGQGINNATYKSLDKHGQPMRSNMVHLMEEEDKRVFRVQIQDM
jgi:hypothetical protein